MGRGPPHEINAAHGGGVQRFGLAASSRARDLRPICAELEAGRARPYAGSRHGRGRASRRTPDIASPQQYLSRTSMPRNTHQPIQPADSESSDVTRHRLIEVRGALLHLHKTLLDHERTAYEQRYGQVAPGELL